MKAGSSNVVGRAQLKPMPRSQDTSTMTLPGRKAARSAGLEIHERLGGVLQGAVDDDVALGQEGRQRLATSLGDHLAEVLAVRLMIELPDHHRVDR